MLCFSWRKNAAEKMGGEGRRKYSRLSSLIIVNQQILLQIGNPVNKTVNNQQMKAYKIRIITKVLTR